MKKWKLHCFNSIHQYPHRSTDEQQCQKTLLINMSCQTDVRFNWPVIENKDALSALQCLKRTSQSTTQRAEQKHTAATQRQTQELQAAISKPAHKTTANFNQHTFRQQHIQSHFMCKSQLQKPLSTIKRNFHLQKKCIFQALWRPLGHAYHQT